MTTRRLAERELKTKFGTWQEVLYYDGKSECIALIYGTVKNRTGVPVRVHSDCISAHVFNSVECDCREQLSMAQAFIQSHGHGAILWLDQDGRGNGHLALMLAARMAAQDLMSQTEAYSRLGYSPDFRHYGQAASIIEDLGIESIDLLSNSPDKEQGLREYGISVARTVSISLDLKEYPQLQTYYADKISRGYTIDLTGESA